MTSTIVLKTNLNCKACVAKLKPYLDAEPSISRWEVNTTVPEKTLTVQGEGVSLDFIKVAVATAGFRVLGELPPPADASSAVSSAQEAALPKIGWATYYPLMLLASFLVGIVMLVEYRMGSWDWGRAMQHFMGAFFLAFAFFKFLDLRGFASSYQMYDVVAKYVPGYALLYPFIELTLGVAYVTGIFPQATNLTTLVVMSVSIVGVLQSVLAKRKIRCACLGSVFNLPMSTVTLVEDGLMIAMAAAALWGMGH